MPAEKMTAELEQTFFSFVLSNHLLPLLFSLYFLMMLYLPIRGEKMQVAFSPDNCKNESAT
jgi:hypothetical protein